MKSKPIRMCVACRGRFEQEKLLRLQQNTSNIPILFTGKGRSFYLCPACIEDKKRLKRLAGRFGCEVEAFVARLKELIDNG